MDDLFDPNQFLLTFPLWFPAHPGIPSKGFTTIVGPAGENATPMFTDDDLANRFLQSAPELSHYVLGSLEKPSDLKDFLDLVEGRGYTHVTIDHERRALYFPIPQLRARCQDP